MKRAVFSILLSILSVSFIFSKALAQDRKPISKARPEILFFYSEACHACQRTEHEVLPAIIKDYGDRTNIVFFDISEIENYKFFLGLSQKYYPDKKANVPAVVIGERMLVGFEEIRDNIKEQLDFFLKRGQFVGLAVVPGVDLFKHFLSFGFFTILIAGLIDGINPCAFMVIAFFISFLAFQGYKRKELIGIGLSFILAVFLTYVLVGLGIFHFLYRLEKFYLVTRMVYYFISILCFILGILAIYDLWVFKRTGETEGMVLQLPKPIKRMINQVIGMHYRRPQEERRQGHYRVNILRLIISAFVTGFLVSLLEAVCTGQTYLPTITFVLKNPDLRIRAMFYLFVYNFMFIIPLTFVLVFSLLGASSDNFSAFIKKHMMLVKVLMAMLFFLLGFLMFFGV